MSSKRIKCSNVLVVLVLFVIITSNHLEWASTTISQGKVQHSQCEYEPKDVQAIPRGVTKLVVEHGMSIGIGCMISLCLQSLCHHPSVATK